MLELEVKPTGLSGPVTTGNGCNGPDLDNFTLSISRKRRQIEIWLLINTNTKS